jgi:hypothetical protein
MFFKKQLTSERVNESNNRCHIDKTLKHPNTFTNIIKWRIQENLCIAYKINGIMESVIKYQENERKNKIKSLGFNLKDIFIYLNTF